MVNTDTIISSMINSPVRVIYARVELLNGSALIDTFRYRDKLISFSIERIGDESKFFGYGVCHRLNVKLIDINRELDITTANQLDIAFGVGSDYVYTCPVFFVSEVHRNETTNELSITAYDALYTASNHTVKELSVFSYGYTLGALAEDCAALIGIPIKYENVNDSSFSTYYPQGANFEGSESIREVLDAIAEATQTIYYINSEWELVFKRLDKDGSPVLTIDKEKYYSLENKDNRRLVEIAHITELGDNLAASIGVSGTTQYIRNNPLWDMRDDTAQLVENALAAIGGFTINQFNCDWRGNFLLEIGDKIELITKDNESAVSYLLNDTIEYNGYYSQKTQWNYNNNDAETESNPTTIGDALKQTYAKVDKVNKEIALMVSDIGAAKEDIAAITLNTDSINATVSAIQETTTNALSGVNDEIATLKNSVSARMTEEDVKITIQNELSNGVDKVETNTGFTFNDDGLTVEKSGSDMKTQITEDGMLVYKNGEAVLTANNVGVDAVNLHATTYLIIGNNSRFEDYGSGRTGCFWIG